MLFFFIILLEIGLQSCSAQCDNYFPKIIGGTVYNTHINDFDADENTVYMCGFTQDDNLAGYSLYDWYSCNHCQVPLVAASDITSNQMKWGFTDKS